VAVLTAIALGAACSPEPTGSARWLSGRRRVWMAGSIVLIVLALVPYAARKLEQAAQDALVSGHPRRASLEAKGAYELEPRPTPLVIVIDSLFPRHRTQDAGVPFPTLFSGVMHDPSTPGIRQDLIDELSLPAEGTGR